VTVPVHRRAIAIAPAHIHRTVAALPAAALVRVQTEALGPR
jgi:hypothetical protein